MRQGRRARWAAAGLGLLLAAPARGWTCVGNPITIEERVCNLGHRCCYSLLNGTEDAWIRTFMARQGIPDQLVPMLGRGHPLGQAMNISDVSGLPIDAYYTRGETSPIKVSLHVEKVSAIDQKRQRFNMQYSLTWTWQDCRLLFSCPQVAFDSRHKSFGDFWSPPLKIKEREDDVTAITSSRHFITGHGWDIYTEDRVSTFACHFDFRDMPFDRQLCNLTIHMPDLFEDRMSLTWLGPVTSDTLDNAEWEIEEGPAWRRWNTSVPVRWGMSEARAVAQFTLKRRPGYLLLNFVLQYVCFYLCSYVGLWVDITAVPARAMLAVVPMLVTANKISALTASLPPISYQTRVGEFAMVNIVAMTIHTISFGCVHFASRRRKQIKEAYEAEQTNAEQGVVMVAERSSFSQWEYAVTEAITRNLEMHMRWFSLVAYFIAGLAIFVR